MSKLNRGTNDLGTLKRQSPTVNSNVKTTNFSRDSQFSSFGRGVVQSDLINGIKRNRHSTSCTDHADGLVILDDFNAGAVTDEIG